METFILSLFKVDFSLFTVITNQPHLPKKSRKNLPRKPPLDPKPNPKKHLKTPNPNYNLSLTLALTLCREFCTGLVQV